jgi:hypothetical protein
VSDPCLQGAIIGEQQQPFAVRVESARRVHTWQSDVVGERGAVRLWRELTQHAEGFVEGDQH